MNDKRYMTLAVIFDKTGENVLMCRRSKQLMLNFIGGHSKVSEDYRDTAIRELQEETGLTPSDVELKFVRHESVSTSVPGYANSAWSLSVYTGKLERDVELKESENLLVWIPVTDHKSLQYRSMGYGDCFTYLLESMAVLGLS